MSRGLNDRFRVVDFFDAPEVLDASITPIPANTDPPLEVVHSLATLVYAISVRDGIGSELIGLYSGAVGQEVLQIVLGGPGDNKEDIYLSKGSRISLRSMGPAISSGSFYVHFLGLA